MPLNQEIKRKVVEKCYNTHMGVHTHTHTHTHRVKPAITQQTNKQGLCQYELFVFLFDVFNGISTLLV